MFLFAVFVLLVLVAWLDRMACAQEAAALTLLRLYAALTPEARERAGKRR
jgi:hypothetical protein